MCRVKKNRNYFSVLYKHHSFIFRCQSALWQSVSCCVLDHNWRILWICNFQTIPCTVDLLGKFTFVLTCRSNPYSLLISVEEDNIKYLSSSDGFDEYQDTSMNDSAVEPSSNASGNEFILF